MSSAALQSYLAGIDPVAAPVVLALDAAIRTAQPDLDVAVKYRIATYALHSDWRTWVCAIQATTEDRQLTRGEIEGGNAWSSPMRCLDNYRSGVLRPLILSCSSNISGTAS